ncbi:CotH kinase family protein [Myxococcus sp. K15C18031901]|uniref:CotH kinase family protein n=1 Tax=Myxococcus dinghuensis TaxID=2906761 RepID=UPI0020A72DCE|nr:CotH kinase family protein [Myxococcus dinghuensis]MCP3099097.1 CotH kinase family protein [Myxococcus dinghuensis]
MHGMHPRPPGLTALLPLLVCLAASPDAEAQAHSTLSPPTVSIQSMDNLRHLLHGGLSGDAPFTRVEVYEGTRLLGTARLSTNTWTLPWTPTRDSHSLRVVAYDGTGAQAKDRVDFQHRSALDDAGLYHRPTLLTLPTQPIGKTRFTLDGSPPTPDSPVYTAPLALLGREGESAPLSHIPTNPEDAPAEWRWRPPTGEVTLATVVRFQQYVGRLPMGPVQTRTYLVGRAPYSLPVLSLATAPANFFDFDVGLYVPGRVHAEHPEWESYWGTGNYMESGEAWERPVHVEWFDASGTRVLAQEAGVRIHGSGSAALPQKSLRLYAKESYGPSTFDAPFFPELSLKRFKRLIVRNGGQDLLSTRLKDCVLQGLLRETDLPIQACRPAVVFLDGEYWGQHDLRERFDEHHFAAHHGLDRDKVVVLEGQGTVEVGKAADAIPYHALLEYARTHDLAQPEHYAQVAGRIDVDEFIDYHVAQLFFGNDDWPSNNYKVWRYRAEDGGPLPGKGDGRWRWLVYDLDAAFNLPPESNTLARVLHDPLIPQPFVLLLRRLLKAPGFRARFLSRFSWHLANTFATPRVLAAIDAAAARLAPEMAEHIARWQLPPSPGTWLANVERLRDAARRRPALMRAHLEAEFGTF